MNGAPSGERLDDAGPFGSAVHPPHRDAPSEAPALAALIRQTRTGEARPGSTGGGARQPPRINTMLTQLRKFLAPPAFEGDEDKTRTANLLHIVLLTLLTAAVSYGVFAPIEPELRLRRVIILGPLIAVLLALMWAMRRGHIRFASNVIIFAMWSTFTVAMTYGAGFNNPAFMGYLVVAVAAGLLLSQRAAIAWSGLSIATSAAVLWANSLGLLTRPTLPRTELSIWLAQAAYIATSVVMLSLARRSIDEGFTRARRELAERRVTEQKLRESEARFRALVENISEAIVLLDSHGAVQYASPATERILGYPAHTRIGRLAFDEGVYPADVDRLKTLFAQVLNQPRAMVTDQLRVWNHKGALVWIDATATNLLDTPGVQAVVVNYRDITGRRQAEDTLRRYTARLETLREIDRAIVAARSPEEIATASLRHLQQLVPYRLAMVAVFDFETHQARLIADMLEDGTRGPWTGRSFPTESFQSLETLRRGETRIAQDIFSPGPRPATDEDLLNEGLRSWMSVPLQYRGVLIGSLNFGSAAPGAFNDEHVEVAAEIADLLAIALQQASLLAETTEALTREQRLNDVARTSSSSLDLSTVLPTIMRLAVELVRADSGVMGLISNDGQSLTHPYLFNLPEDLGLEQPIPKGTGVGWQVVETRQAMLLADYGSHPAALKNWTAAGIRNSIETPLIAGETCLGVLGLYLRGPARRFTERDLRLAEAVGRQAGVVVQNARLFEAERQRVALLTALNEIGLDISAQLDLSILLNTIVQHAVRLLNAPMGSLFLVRENQSLEMVVRHNLPAFELTRPPVRFGEGLAGKVAQNGRVQIVGDYSQWPGRSSYADDYPYRGVLSVPIKWQGHVIGVINVLDERPDRFGPMDVHQVNLLAAQAAIAINNAHLFSDLQQSNAELIAAYDTTLEGWTRALDLRDEETEGHTQRVTEMTLQLAQGMGIDASELLHIRRGALLHDIGKMGLPDSILLKAGPLTDEEQAVMYKHPEYARDMLFPIKFLRPALDIPYCHHERWDGSGYPQALQGEAIPLAARIFAVVDVWDALRSDRPYRQGWPEKAVLDHIRALSGRHFDPEVVRAFITLLDRAQQPGGAPGL
jgi:PAS domain S-box-containing protein